MAFVTIDSEKCKGCGICIAVCPKKVLGFSKDIINAKGYCPAAALKEGCTGCAACAKMCPDCVITVDR